MSWSTTSANGSCDSRSRPAQAAQQGRLHATWPKDRAAVVRDGTPIAYTYDDIVPHVRQIGEVDFSVMSRLLSPMRGHSAADVLPTIAVPVLILGGERDHFTPPTVQYRMHESIPDSELVMFPDGGHRPVEEADGIAVALADWLVRRCA